MAMGWTTRATCGTVASARITRTTGPTRPTGLHKALVRLAVKAPRDLREGLGQHVVIRPIRKLGRHAFAAVAFVEIAGAFDEFPVRGERAVVLAIRRVVATGALALLQAVARLELRHPTLRIIRIRVTVLRVDRISVGRPAKPRHLLAAMVAGTVPHQADRDAGIVVGAGRW